jgi:hypothetical protein
MNQDVDKAKKKVPAQKSPIDKSLEKRKPSSDDGKRKRGWRDVFDNLTYSSGPGDNIYVFG